MTDRQKERALQMRESEETLARIAKELEVSLNAVQSYFSRHSQAEELDGPTHCAQCGRELVQVPGRKKKRSCCDECRHAWWNSHLDQVNRKAYRDVQCKLCGKTFQVSGARERKYCCHECYIAERFGRISTVDAICAEHFNDTGTAQEDV